MSDNKRVIVALDCSSGADAIALAQSLDPALCRVKVGNEVFTSAGPSVVEALHKLEFEVFLDLKFHDIPNTVAGACRAAKNLGVWMLNVHISGGEQMMAGARDAVGAAGSGVPLLIGVTVLTSLSAPDLVAMGVERSVEEQVVALAQAAQRSGLDGVVCSAREAAVLAVETPGQLSVTPGIRLAEDSSDDQARITTPEQAIKNGAGYLVIGRSITAAQNPLQRLQQIDAALKSL
ncbi:orotidine 5'-phosphate decarboxylase [Chromatiales bacterium (ex Bugula neritina AB1)]|nr:orotidine 5'-phosphate decarboxylase [Chromatiales bacterium (ex Bugula neritina AB1)]